MGRKKIKVNEYGAGILDTINNIENQEATSMSHLFFDVKEDIFIIIVKIG